MVFKISVQVKGKQIILIPVDHAVCALKNQHFTEGTHEIKDELVTCLSEKSFFIATRNQSLVQSLAEGGASHGSQLRGHGIRNFPRCCFRWTNPIPGE